jgi:hypothetical protein
MARALQSRALRGTAHGGQGVQGVPWACPDSRQTLLQAVAGRAAGCSRETTIFQEWALQL